MFKEIIDLYSTRGDFFLELTLEHLMICGISILLSLAFGIFFGILISEYKKTTPLVLGVTNFIYTIPSIAMLGFLIPFFGIGNFTAIIALVVYGLLPVVRNTYTGIDTIPKEVITAAVGMGSTNMQVLFKIKLPLALLVIISGLRTMAIMTIALAGIAAFIGAGGLGVAIYRGITTNNMAMTIAGSLLIAALAFIIDFIISRIEKYIKKKRRLEV